MKVLHVINTLSGYFRLFVKYYGKYKENLNLSVTRHKYEMLYHRRSVTLVTCELHSDRVSRHPRFICDLRLLNDTLFFLPYLELLQNITKI